MSRRDPTPRTAEQSETGTVFDVRAAASLLGEPDATAAVRLLAGVFLVAGVGAGATALFYDALGSSGAGQLYSPGAALVGTVRNAAPLLATGGGLLVGRRTSGGQKAVLAGLVGSAIGHLGFALSLYLFEGLVTEFGEVQFGAAIGLTLGVGVAGALGAFAGGRLDGP